MRSFTLLLTILSITAANALHAQTTDSTVAKAAASPFQLSGAVDIYYGYDFPSLLTRTACTPRRRTGTISLT